MNEGTIRYKSNPSLNDTTGFFNSHRPYSLIDGYPANDSVAKFYTIPNLPSCEKHNYFPEKHMVTSIFINHNLKADFRGPRPIEKPSNDWIIAIIMVCLFLFAWIENNYAKRLRQIFKSIAQPYFVNQLEREGNLLQERISYVLLTIFITGLALTIFLITESTFPGSIPNRQRFIIFAGIVAGIAGYLSLKTLLIRFTGVLFKNNNMAHSHLIINIIFNQVSGLELFAGSSLAFLTGQSMFAWGGAILAIITFVIRTYRQIISGINDGRLSIIKIIFYLCTLEFMPLLIILKAITNLLSA
jgi:phage shock protein PspC (stress-responsive transcriptional regulator)